MSRVGVNDLKLVVEEPYSLWKCELFLRTYQNSWKFKREMGTRIGIHPLPTYHVWFARMDK